MLMAHAPSCPPRRDIFIMLMVLYTILGLPYQVVMPPPPPPLLLPSWFAGYTAVAHYPTVIFHCSNFDSSC